jgi:5'-methylthioadenosine phosphorylase
MREEIEPLHVVVPDQIFDRTVSRPRTFFDNFVVHVALDNPFCGSVQQDLYAAAQTAGANCHQGGVYICIEGPQFSTKAESRVYRSWGMDIIGMTAMPEARLAREAGLCYGLLAMVTDFDVWHETEEPVSVQTILDNLRKNVELSRAIVRNAVQSLAHPRECSCRSMVKDAIATAETGIAQEERERLALLLPG